jgi:hypothetical protein
MMPLLDQHPLPFACRHGVCVIRQTVAQTYSARVTFISGDVHCGGFGCFQAHPKQFNRVVDHKYMLQVGVP